MASITSMINGSSNLSSIYGNRNVLSGLASGMDTETMIENAVSGIKLKIQKLMQQRTKVEWQQEAYRSIIDKAVNLNNKYTSYASSTNLLSQSFFNNAVNTTTLGTYKDKVTASGRTTSDIKLNAVKQLATAASYTVSGLAGAAKGEIPGVTGKEFDIAAAIPVSTVSGSLSLQYGGTNGTTFDITFDELENIDEIEVKNADGSVKTNATNAEKLAQAINNKLSDIAYTYTKNGYSEHTTADKAVKAVANADGSITFTDGLKNGNKINIVSSSGNIRANFGISNEDEKISVGGTALTQPTATHRYLSDKALGITFNGTTKSIDLSKVISATDVSGDDPNGSFVAALQKELDSTFGAGKIKAAYDDGKLSFTPSKKGDTLTLGGTGVKAMGFDTGDANYINSSKKLTDLLGDRAGTVFSQANRLAGAGGAIAKTRADGSTYYVDIKGSYVDKNGYRVDSTGKAMYDFEVNGAHIGITEDTTLERLMTSVNANADAGVKMSYSTLTNEFKFTATETGANGKIEFGKTADALFGNPGGSGLVVDSATSAADILGGGYDYGSQYSNFTMNVGGESFSIHVDKNSTMESIVNDLNDMISTVGEFDDERFKGVTASFDAASGSIVFKDADGKEMESSAGNGIAKDLLDKVGASVPNGSYVQGQDAILDVEINGTRFENLTRSSNSVNLDGLTINVKSTFEAVGKDGEDYEPVTFNTTTDTDKIVDVIKQFVEDYNEMAAELKSAYSTMPAQKSDGSRYDPLTSDDEEGMTESEIKSYNEKAKQGILFGDTTLSSFYSKLLSSITPGGEDGQTLREIGINTSYSDGMTTLSLDEDKLRSALESDPDKVKDAFTKTTESGSSSNGLMQSLQNTLNTYVKTTGEPKGVLITRAGSVKAPTSINSNSLQSKINNIDKQIDRWQNKMSTQIDRYTTKFTRLEQLIAEMNSQASAMSGLMGGGSEY